ncbi:MAG: hypothetical protein IMZ59_05100 [Actinobacteria bacterium]|nr:hypothetical protein [Actinomycetota bacterium]
MKKLGLMGIDQYGQHYKLKTDHPRKELQEILGRKHTDKMYVDTKTGDTKHIGYIINGLWITLYEIHEWSKKEG